MDQPANPGGPPYPPAPGHPPYGTPVRSPWLVPPPPGTPYHRLARTEVHRWWRPLLGTLLVALAFVVAGAAVVIVGVIVARMAGVGAPATGEDLTGDPLVTFTLLLLSIAVVLPLTFVVAALVQRRPPGTLSSVAGRLRWGWLWLCVGAAVVAAVCGQIGRVLAFVLTGEGGDGGTFTWAGWAAFAPALVITVLVVPFQAAAEEYIFRGWLLQAFGAYLRSPWPGIVISAAVFTSVHAYTGWGILDVFAFGLLMGWLAVRTGGLEAAIAVHTLNNVVSFLISASAGELGEALRQGAVPWQSLVGTIVQLTVFAALVLFFAKKRAIQTVSR